MRITQDAGTLSKILALFLLATGIWGIVVAYKIQSKLYNITLEKRAIQANSGLLTCSWIFIFMAILLFLFSTKLKSRAGKSYTKDTGKWIMLGISLAVSISAVIYLFTTYLFSPLLQVLCWSEPTI